MLIILIIGVYLIVVMLILLFFRGIRREEEFIYRTLENRDKLQGTLFDEIKRCSEEDNKLYTALVKADYDKSIEEFWRSTGRKIKLLEMAGISAEDINKGLRILLDNQKGE